MRGVGCACEYRIAKVIIVLILQKKTCYFFLEYFISLITGSNICCFLIRCIFVLKKIIKKMPEKLFCIPGHLTITIFFY